MHCLFCDENDTRVLESRLTDAGKTIRRRRECSGCSKRFTTYERMELSPLVIIKRSGSREIYSRDKLIKSIVRSCSKSQISTLTIESIVDEVESKMYEFSNKEISSFDLGNIIMETLKSIDPLAYIRYLSVFRRFQSVDKFIETIKDLEDSLLGIQYETMDSSPRGVLSGKALSIQ